MWRTDKAPRQNHPKSGAGDRKPTDQEWVPQGTRIGWVRGSDLFLDPVSYRSRPGLVGFGALSTSQQALHHRLLESGLLVSVDGRQMCRCAVTLEGCPRQVLHLKAADLAGEFQEAGRHGQHFEWYDGSPSFAGIVGSVGTSKTEAGIQTPYARAFTTSP